MQVPIFVRGEGWRCKPQEPGLINYCCNDRVGHASSGNTRVGGGGGGVPRRASPDTF